MIADDETGEQIQDLIDRTYAGLSNRGPSVGALFSTHPDVAIAGSGQGELVYGPERSGRMADGAASLGYRWTADEVRIWRNGNVAWAQILGSVHVEREGRVEDVPYWTTGVFELTSAGWEWAYWGGAEPQAEPRV